MRRERVPGAGLEPASPFGQWCLRPSRLPDFATRAGWPSLHRLPHQLCTRTADPGRRPRYTVARRAVRRLLSEGDARLHVSRPGVAASGDGTAVARPRELGAGQRSERDRRARHRQAAPRRRRRRAARHPQRPADDVRVEPDGPRRRRAPRHRAELLRRPQPRRVHGADGDRRRSASTTACRW